jgi:hypothetical protein
LKVGDDLLLVNPARDAYLQVTREDAGRMTLDQFRDSFLDRYRDARAPGGPKKLEDVMRFSDFHLRESRRLPPRDGAEVAEVVFEAKVAGQNLAYRARLVRPRAGTDVFVLVAWAHRRRLPPLEPELTRALDSFRLLPDG